MRSNCEPLIVSYAAAAAAAVVAATVTVDAAAVRGCGKELKPNLRGCWLRLSLCLLLFSLWYL